MEKDMSWVKGLLNNMPLLKWVKKFSADNLFDDNKLVESYGVKTNEDSISVADDTLTKIIATHSRFAGKELVRFNLKQIHQLTEVLGSEGELIITDGKNKEMAVQIKDNVVIVCPLPKQDKAEGE